MINFNLSKYLLKTKEDLIKEAMGYTRQEKRDNYDWWDYDEISGGGDERWQRHLMRDRSLADVLVDAGHYKGRAVSDIQSIYGIDRNEAWKVFKVYIGYHPSYGAYICGIGPYLGSKFSEAQDKFAYFIKRCRSSTQQEIMDSVRKNIEQYAETYGIQLDPSDLQFVVKGAKEAYQPERKRQPREVREVVVSLDPDSEQTQDFFRRHPVAAEGSYFGLNAKGLEKIIRHLYGNYYIESLREKTSEEGISQRESTIRAISDLAYLQSIYDKVKEKYNMAVESGEAAVEGMQPPPKMLDLSLAGKSGQIIFTAIPQGKLQSRQLALRKEITDFLNQGVSQENLLSRLNAQPKRRNDPLTEEQVNDELEIINTSIREENVNYETYATNLSSTIESLKEQRGFPDLKTAFEMAKLYFTNLPIDPQTRGKKGIKYAPTMAFDPPENFENYTEQDIRELRIENERRKAGLPPSEEAAEEVDVEKVLEKEIGKEKEIEPAEMVKEPSKPEDLVEETKLPGGAKIEEIEKVEGDDTEEVVPRIPSRLKNIFESTLKNLIKIAKESDDKGNYDNAEEIHKIIRKYVERIS